MQEIMLTQGKVALVDDCDYEELNKHKWCACKCRNTFYAKRCKTIDGKRTTLYMHNIILGEKHGLVIDHKNGNGLDNRKENIRHTTVRGNNCNKHIMKSSKYPFVHWRKDKKLWQSTVRINNKTKHIGYFKEEIKAYNKAILFLKEILGEIAFNTSYYVNYGGIVK